MATLETYFKIIENNKCPMYKDGDEFRLSGNAISLELKQEKIFITTAIIKAPIEKKTCRILVGDLTKILIEYESIDKIPSSAVSCKGCTGTIKLKYTREKGELSDDTPPVRSENVNVIANVLSNFSIFQTLDVDSLKDIVPFLKLKKFPKGATILKKGTPAQNLFIILSGIVDVLDDDGVRLSSLKKGDIFGEMSLISGDPVGATIKVMKPATIVFIRGRDFNDVIIKFPSIQMYLARLLAQRLAKSNVERSEEATSGMSGTLAEMPPSEVLQTLNLNQKTGKLTLSLQDTDAVFYFDEGEVVYIKYGKTTGKDAFFKILREKQGRFSFQPGPIEGNKKLPVVGPFLELLLEGLRRIDETDNDNIKKVS